MEMDYAKDINRSLGGDEYLPAGKNSVLFDLQVQKHGNYRSRLLYGQLSGRRRPNHAHPCVSPHRPSTKTRSKSKM